MKTAASFVSVLNDFCKNNDLEPFRFDKKRMERLERTYAMLHFSPPTYVFVDFVARTPARNSIELRAAIHGELQKESLSFNPDVLSELEKNIAKEAQEVKVTFYFKGIGHHANKLFFKWKK